MVNAFRAGTIVAIVAAAIGWFMVLRRQTFAGHTLAVVGVSRRGRRDLARRQRGLGLLRLLHRRRARDRERSRGPAGAATARSRPSIGTVQAFALACGFLFVEPLRRVPQRVQRRCCSAASSASPTRRSSRCSLVGAAVALVVAGVIARPLLFARSIPMSPHARGVPVRLLSIVFLVVLGVAVAEASQITGALLVFALLVVPAATAQTLTARPVAGLSRRSPSVSRSRGSRSEPASTSNTLTEPRHAT